METLKKNEFGLGHQSKKPYTRGPFQHYNDVMMSAMASQITSLFDHPFVHGADRRKYQSSTSLASVRGSVGFPSQMASNAENDSIWWRHHEYHLKFIFVRSCKILEAWFFLFKVFQVAVKCRLDSTAAESPVKFRCDIYIWQIEAWAKRPIFCRQHF